MVILNASRGPSLVPGPEEKVNSCGVRTLNPGLYIMLCLCIILMHMLSTTCHSDYKKAVLYHNVPCHQCNIILAIIQ